MSERERGIQGVPGKRGVPGPPGAASTFLGKKQTLALFGFVLFAFLVLSVRSEINADEIRGNADRISRTQQITCESSREILRKYNEQQNTLIAIEIANTDADIRTREARIEAYRVGRIDPLPACQ